MQALKGRGTQGRGLSRFLRTLAGDESGQGMTEYILLIFLIALACIWGIRMYGGKIKKGYSRGAETLGNIAR
ncbi:hypothetical protein KKF70_03745 [bacterium]|nr:hypothetical protein [Candidatus Omnitrophota bacterium]MBU2528485.1 hypothetical protein [bacterium]MBU3930807.1 hypothetical protein [bacterium]MBU4122408.1 hypothetical protein [bacterium]MDO9514132.1 hypothetical protein [Elusimicrobiota bacterium]